MADKLENMTESTARGIFAESINDLLVRIYQHIIPETGFVTELFLDDFTDTEVINFGIATTGFLSMQNFEQIASGLSSSDIDNIIGGTFNLKQLSRQDVLEMTSGLDTKTTTKNGVTKTVLYKIQDSSYAIVSRYGKNKLVLKTPEVEYHSPSKVACSTKDMLQLIRNLSAHSMPYKFASKVVYYTNDGYVSLPRMWFRGYSELFAKDDPTFDSKTAKEILLKELPASGNTLENSKDINKALSLIKNLFDADTLKNFFRVNNFVNYRIACDPIFFEMNFEDKVETLVQIIEKNPNYISSASETINPRIIYNLQQLVSHELTKRQAKSQLNEDDEIFEEVARFQKEYEDFHKQYELIQKVKNPNPALVKNLLKKSEALDAKQKSIEQTLLAREKLESANMGLYNASDLEYLSVEVAVNLIALMGYNSLVSSAFYEDTLANTSLSNLSAEQKRFFKEINLDNLTYSFGTKKFTTPYDDENKAFILSAIRNAICHGLISFQLPPISNDKVTNFEDVQVTFYRDRDDSKVTGSVKDFFEIFSSSFFTKERPEYIITRPITMMQRNLPTIPKAPKFAKCPKEKQGPGDSGDE